MALFNEVSHRRWRPEYEAKVDSDMFKYKDYEYTIPALKEQLTDIELTGRKMIATYELIEGGRTNQISIPEENIVIVSDTLKGRIEAMLNYREHMDKLVNDCFDEEHQQFIRLYWWEPSQKMRGIRIRKAIVLHNMPHLHNRNAGDSQFYRWRDKLYLDLAKMFGHV